MPFISGVMAPILVYGVPSCPLLLDDVDQAVSAQQLGHVKAVLFFRREGPTAPDSRSLRSAAAFVHGQEPRLADGERLAIVHAVFAPAVPTMR